MQVDHLIGRTVTNVAEAVSNEDWDWSIGFDGDVRIRYTGNENIPTSIDGTALGTVTEKGGKTTMGFYGGNPATLIETVELKTKDLTIKEPDKEPVVPIVEPVDPEKDRPADPSPMRVAGGPLDDR